MQRHRARPGNGLRVRRAKSSASSCVCALSLLFLFAPVSVAHAQPVHHVDDTLLDRLGFGPDPWTRERVGAREHRLFYIVEQLLPETIDDSAFEALLAAYPSLTMSYAELRANYCSDCPLGDSDRPLEEAGAAKLLRAIASRRQLEAVLADFWFDWFNVDARSGLAHIAVVPMERDAIRAHVFGRFEDMLIAVTRSPAMLDYLDNRFNRVNALNENFSREVLELHTIGEGSFTQNDVIEVARALTGWTVQADAFSYRDEWHDQQPKRILDTLDLPANGGEEDGLSLLRFLARHPLTGERVCRRLVDFFYSEQQLARRNMKGCESVFADTQGDLRAVMFQLLAGIRFVRFDPESRVKRPQHLVASTYRALGRIPGDEELMERVDDLRRMGHAPFEAGPPTGFPQRSEYWASEGGVIDRVNWLRELVEAAEPDFGIVTNDGEEIVDALAQRLLLRELGEATRAELVAYLAEIEDEPQEVRVREAAALLLAGPEFSRY